MNNSENIPKILIFAGITYMLYQKLKPKQCFACNHNPKLPNGKLGPIMDPMFNVREACKELVLLEQHLNDPTKRCGDCQKKHFLTIEGLFEEAIALDKYHSYNLLLKDLPAKIKTIALAHANGESTPCATAQKLRQIRKPLMPISFKNV